MTGYRDVVDFGSWFLHMFLWNINWVSSIDCIFGENMIINILENIKMRYLVDRLWDHNSNETRSLEHKHNTNIVIYDQKPGNSSVQKIWFFFIAMATMKQHCYWCTVNLSYRDVLDLIDRILWHGRLWFFNTTYVSVRCHKKESFHQ